MLGTETENPVIIGRLKSLCYDLEFLMKSLYADWRLLKVKYSMSVFQSNNSLVWVIFKCLSCLLGPRTMDVIKSINLMGDCNTTLRTGYKLKRKKKKSISQKNSRWHLDVMFKVCCSIVNSVKVSVPHDHTELCLQTSARYLLTLSPCHRGRLE